jgi:hypothetical protein
MLRQRVGRKEVAHDAMCALHPEREMRVCPASCVMGRRKRLRMEKKKRHRFDESIGIERRQTEIEDRDIDRSIDR